MDTLIESLVKMVRKAGQRTGVAVGPVLWHLLFVGVGREKGLKILTCYGV
jgi:hypothetical protein